MAEVQDAPNGAIATEGAVHATTHIPIGQLTPILAGPAGRSIKAIVTLTWPFSSVSGSVAFLLAEPDFRLRRIRGQVRVQFAGSSAKAVAKAGIASGDEVLLSLEGVEFVQNEGTIISTPGRGVEFELKFTERLVAEFRSEGSEELKKINIDHPEAEPESDPTRLPTPERSLSPLPPADTTQSDKGFLLLEGGEWSSPAFIKRSRTSYGSLFESDYDPFSPEADGSVRGKGRKRTRLSSSWRYHSHSPTPEPEDEVMVQVEASPSKPAPVMMDEACQTAELDENSAAEALADFSRQANNVGGTAYETISKAPIQEIQDNYEAEPIVQETITQVAAEAQVLDTDAMDTPRSPRLEPISSDAFPIVSPLMPFKSGPSEVSTAQAEITLDQDFHEQLASNTADGVEAMEDLYNASPIHRREDTSLDEVADDQALETEDFEASLPAEINNTEDQYGRWQTVNAQANEPRSHHTSQERVIEEQFEPPQDMQYEGEMDYPEETQYPALEDDLQDNPPIGWNFRSADAGYLDIPEVYAPRGHSTSMDPPPPRSAAMSRSQSAAMSEPIDLTEDDDEDEIPQSAALSTFDDDVEGYDEEFEDEFEEEFEDDEEEHLRASRYESGGLEHTVLDDGQLDDPDAYDEEESSEDEFGADRAGSERLRDSDKAHPRRMLHEGQSDEQGLDLEDYDDKESDEDEDIADDGRRGQSLVNKGPPEVIEILSSDDEEEVAPPRKPSHDRISSRPQQEEYEVEESNEIMGSDDDGQVLERSDSDGHDSLLGDDRSEASEQPEPLIDGEVGEGNQDVSESEESEAEEYISSAPLLRGLNPEGGKIRRRAKFEQEDEFSEEELQVDIQEEEDVSSRPQLSRHSQSPLEMQSKRGGSRRPFLPRNQSMDGAADEPNEPEADYPELSGDEISQPEVETTETVTQTIEFETMKKGNVQLPTALLDTQLTEKVTSVEQSITTVTGDLVVESEQSVNDQDVQMIIDASEQSLNDQDIQTMIEASEQALDDEMIDVEEYVGIESPEPEPAVEDKIGHLENPRPSSSDAQLVGSIEGMEETMETSVVEQEDQPRQHSSIPDNPLSSIIKDAFEKFEEDAEMEENEDLEPSSPVPTFMDATPVPETLKEFEHVNEEANEEASRGNENSPLPTPQQEPIFGPFAEELVDEAQEASKELQNVSSPAEINAASPSNFDDPLPETLEEVFEHIIEDAEKEASEEVELDSPVSEGPETLEQQMQRIIQEAEREAAEEQREAAEELRRSAQPPVVSETLEEEYDDIIEEAENEANDELRSSDLPPAVPETLEEEYDHIIEDAAKEAQMLADSEAQEAVHFLRNHPENAPAHRTSMDAISRSSPVSRVSTVANSPSGHSRRSSRQLKPIPDALDKNENARPVTPVKRNTRQDQVSPMVVLDSRETLTGHDASLELALSSAISPVKHNVRNPAASDVKLRLSRALKTVLSEFTPLKLIRFHLNQKLDVLGVATTTPPEPQRAKGGPRDYHLVFNITDPSIAPSGVTEVQVFRPYSDALPRVQVGDGVLLRNFKVVSVKRGFALHSMPDEGSSWAVFKDGDEPEMRGPPVEFGNGERSHIKELKGWYESLDGTAMKKIERANGDKAAAGGTPSKSRPGSASKSISKA